jgi:hypothetical protein
VFVSLIGFLVGLTIAGGAGYHYLLDEYNTASRLLLSSVEELQKSTNKVQRTTNKINLNLRVNNNMLQK